MARADEETRRIHVMIFASDLDWMQQTFGSTLSISKIIRALVRRTRKEIESNQAAETDSGSVKLALPLDLDQ